MKKTKKKLTKNSNPSESIMKLLAEKTGLEFDGHNDNRLFYQEDNINVFAKHMSEKEYNRMEKSLKKTIKGKGYLVYAWNDASGYEYWKTEDSNYIQVTVAINDLNKVDIFQLKHDVNELFGYFKTFDNTDRHFQLEYQMETK